MKKPKHLSERAKMILYRCPSCGMANLKDIQEVKHNDVWECVYCTKEMKVAQ